MSEIITYDKAKYHFESVEEHGLPEIHAYIHTGLYLGWLIENNLLDQEFINDFGQKIPQLLDKEITATDIFADWDGVLANDMLNEEGISFSNYYFDFENGQYINDYIKIMASDLPSEFHVDNTWENYEKVKSFIDDRYREWKEPLTKVTQSSKKWWQFWR